MSLGDILNDIKINIMIFSFIIKINGSTCKLKRQFISYIMSIRDSLNDIKYID